MIKKINNLYIILLILLIASIFIIKHIYTHSYNKNNHLNQFFLKNLNLDNTIEKVKKIKISFNSDKITLVENSDGKWVILEKSNYPVLEFKIKELVFDLANLKIIESKTSKIENFAILNVEDININKLTTSIELFNEHDQEIDSIYIGQREFIASKNADPQSHVFVRKPKENQVWLVAGKLSESFAFKDLVKQPIFSIDLSSIVQIELKKTNQNAKNFIKIIRDPNTKELTLLEIPPRYKIKEQYVIDNIIQQFKYLNYDDVILNQPTAVEVLNGKITINANNTTQNIIEFNLMYLNKNYYLKPNDSNWLYKISDYTYQSLLINKNDLLVEITKKPTKIIKK